MSDLDLITTIVVGALSGGAGKIVAAPLEGAADAVRERMKGRVLRTMEKARAKTGGRPFEPNDRVHVKVLNEAAWTDDEIISDYLGGVLAATGPTNDAGAAIVALISRLSADQLRLHFVIYREIRRLWPDPDVNLYEQPKADKAAISIPITDLVEALGGSGTANASSSMYALAREDLIGNGWSVLFDPTDKKYGLRAKPTAIGAELFLWGHGSKDHQANVLLDQDADLVFETEVAATPNSHLLTPPDPPVTPAPDEPNAPA